MVGFVLSLKEKWPRHVVLIPLCWFVKVCVSDEFSLKSEVTQGVMQPGLAQWSRAGSCPWWSIHSFLWMFGVSVQNWALCTQPDPQGVGESGFGNCSTRVPSLGENSEGEKFWLETRDEDKVNSVILELWPCCTWEHHGKQQTFHLFSAKPEEFEEPWPVQLWDYKPWGLQGQHLWAAPADHIPGWVWSGGQRGPRLRRWWWW